MNISPIKQLMIDKYKDKIYKLYIINNFSTGKILELIDLSYKDILLIIKACNFIKNKEQTKIANNNYHVECMQRKYGDNITNPSQLKYVQDKRKQTCQERYGVDNPWQIKEVKEKIKQSNLDNFGVEYPMQNETIKEKSKQTCIAKYGVDNPAKSLEIQNKIQKTNIKRYGGIAPAKSKLVSNKIKTSWIINNSCQKEYETKKKNKSFNSSKIEDLIFEKLSLKFKEVKRQYKSEEYPFVCDFYIPSLNLYIEYQGTWTHGNYAFDPLNQKCLEQLNEWIKKSKKSQFYQNAIDVWTIKDVEKRTIAKQNNLNYLEFFNMKEFEKWYNN